MSTLRLSFGALVIVLSGSTAAVSCGGGSGSNGIIYAAIGASDATGVGADPFTNGYAYRIENSLNECAEVDLLNLGIPGAEIDEFEDIEVPIALREDPDLVTIWAGANDIVSGTSVEEFETRLRRVVSRLREAAPLIVAVGNVPDLTKLPRFQADPDPDVTAERVGAYNSVIERVAAEHGAQLVDLASVGFDDSLVDDDGFHPSDDGHRRIAEEFLGVIRPLICAG